MHADSLLVLAVYKSNLVHSLPVTALSSWFGLFQTALPKQPISVLTSNLWSVTPLYTLLVYKLVCQMPWCSFSLYKALSIYIFVDRALHTLEKVTCRTISNHLISLKQVLSIFKCGEEEPQLVLLYIKNKWYCGVSRPFDILYLCHYNPGFVFLQPSFLRTTY